MVKSLLQIKSELKRKQEPVVIKKTVIEKQKYDDSKLTSDIKSLFTIINELLQFNGDIIDAINNVQPNTVILKQPEKIIERTVKVIKEKVKDGKSVSEQDILNIIQKNIRLPYRGGGATTLAQLSDVNLDNAEQDAEGKYIIPGGGSKIGCQDFSYDFDQDDYYYVGGINKDNIYQINRYTKSQPVTVAYAFDDWANRLTATYTNI